MSKPHLRVLQGDNLARSVGVGPLWTGTRARLGIRSIRAASAGGGDDALEAIKVVDLERIAPRAASAPASKRGKR